MWGNLTLLHALIRKAEYSSIAEFVGKFPSHLSYDRPLHFGLMDLAPKLGDIKIDGLGQIFDAVLSTGELLPATQGQLLVTRDG